MNFAWNRSPSNRRKLIHLPVGLKELNSHSWGVKRLKSAEARRSIDYIFITLIINMMNTIKHIKPKLIE